MMARKKIIYVYGLLFLAAVLMISVVSAGFGDWVKGLFGGEPQFGPFNATATVAGVAPYIHTVLVDSNFSSVIGVATPSEGIINTLVVTFIAHDDNSNIELPTGAVTLGNSNGQINIALKKIASHKSALELAGIIGNTVCTEVPCAPYVQCTQPSLERAYNCTMNVMEYYYEPSSSALTTLWWVNVNISDTTGLRGDGNSTGNFTYTSIASFAISGNISWENIGLTRTNQLGTENLTMLNKGNSVRNSTLIRAFNLTGVQYSPTVNSFIPVRAIMGNGTSGTACTSPNVWSAGEGLKDAVDASVAGFQLDYGSSCLPAGACNPIANASIFFCIYPQLNTLQPSSPLQFVDQTYIARGTTAPCYGSATVATGTCAWLLTII